MDFKCVGVAQVICNNRATPLSFLKVHLYSIQEAPMMRGPLMFALLLVCCIVLTASLPQLPAHSRTKRAACGDCAHFWFNPVVVAACYAGCEICGPSMENCGGGGGGGGAGNTINGNPDDGPDSRWGPGGPTGLDG